MKLMVCNQNHEVQMCGRRGGGRIERVLDIVDIFVVREFLWTLHNKYVGSRIENFVIIGTNCQ